MSFGLTAAGFRAKRYVDVLDSMQGRARELFGEDVNLGNSSPLGIFLKVLAWPIGNLWGVAEAVYNAAFVDTAEGGDLDKIGMFIGISRRQALAAAGEVTFSGSDGTLIPGGTLVETTGGVEFFTEDDVEVVSGEATVEVEAAAPGQEGNVPGGTITVVTNPMAGVTGVTNADPTTGGLDRETDDEFRDRYARSVARPGSSTAASMEATLLDVDGVIDAYVRVNETMGTVDDIPAKAISPIVYGGDEGDIAGAIFATKAAGIQSFGIDDGTRVQVTVEDSRGAEFTIGFNRPEEVDVWVLAELDVSSDYPVDGDDRVEEAILGYIQALGLGDDVIYTKVIAVIQTVPGILDITNLRVDTVEPPMGTGNISIGEYQVTLADAAKVEVDSS